MAVARKVARVFSGVQEIEKGMNLTCIKAV